MDCACARATSAVQVCTSGFFNVTIIHLCETLIVYLWQGQVAASVAFFISSSAAGLTGNCAPCFRQAVHNADPGVIMASTEALPTGGWVVTGTAHSARELAKREARAGRATPPSMNRPGIDGAPHGGGCATPDASPPPRARPAGGDRYADRALALPCARPPRTIPYHAILYYITILYYDTF